jgi:hypothetical protein
VLLNPTRWDGPQPHLGFLVVFAAVMVLAAWMSYWSMVQVERRL